MSGALRLPMCTPCREDRNHDTCHNVGGALYRPGQPGDLARNLLMVNRPVSASDLGDVTEAEQETCFCHVAGHPTLTNQEAP